MDLTMNRNMDRRHADRRSAGAGLSSLTLALRTGTTLEVIDMSAGGALVETSARLEPGTNLAIRALSTRTGVVHRATVIHCRVWSLDRRSGIRFRAGLRFATSSGYPSKESPRVCGNALPKHSRDQPALWAARGKINREPHAGAQIV
jgi:hypothetical protein